MNAEQIGFWAGFAFTLMVFSYLLGDNFFYRLAVYVFVGLAAGFITIVTVEGVLLPWVNSTMLSRSGVGVTVVGAIPLGLGLLLLLKMRPRLARLGNLAIAFIIGVGSAVALAGAISGTLVPLAGATSGAVQTDVLNGFILVLGVISSLVYFSYRARRLPTGEVQRGLLTRFVGAVGQGFIVVALGALYAGAIITSLTIFSERIAFIWGRITGS